LSARERTNFACWLQKSLSISRAWKSNSWLLSTLNVPGEVWLGSQISPESMTQMSGWLLAITLAPRPTGATMPQTPPIAAP
jgi:hypothetical protein